jgi:nicotinamide-nucleotide amidase
MILEVINTGSELLLGGTVNTHLAYLGQELFPLGLRIARQITVPDGDEIRAALAESLSRADVILVTGGLGPTTDDVTREITAELLGLPMIEDASVWNSIQERFQRRGLALSPRNRRQAQVPKGATVLVNANGTAPGLYIAHKDAGRGALRHIFLLPGPPRELRPMFRDTGAPILKGLVPGGPAMQSRRWMVTGLSESNLEAMVGEDLLKVPGLELGYCARLGVVELRCIGAPEALAAAEEIVTAKLGAHVASEAGENLETVVVHRLTSLGKKLAVAESCTGGLLANRITNVPGASEVFVEGFVTYSNESKTRALGVPAELISAHGAVSEPVARAMAEGALREGKADYALATTGIAGPGGGTPEKPVGTVFIALAGHDGETWVEQHAFPRDRESFKEYAVNTALDMLRTVLR